MTNQPKGQEAEKPPINGNVTGNGSMKRQENKSSPIRRRIGMEDDGDTAPHPAVPPARLSVHDFTSDDDKDAKTDKQQTRTVANGADASDADDKGEGNTSKVSSLFETMEKDGASFMHSPVPPNVDGWKKKAAASSRTRVYNSRRSVEDTGNQPLAPPIRKSKKRKADVVDSTTTGGEALERSAVLAGEASMMGSLRPNNAPRVTQPGAVAVRGPEHSNSIASSFDIESRDQGSFDSRLVPPQASQHIREDGTTLDNVQITAIPIDEDDLEAHFRNQILADAAQAEVVTNKEGQKRVFWCWVGLVVLVLIGTAVGLSVGLTGSGSGSADDSNNPSFDPCDDAENSDVVTQCECLGSITGVSTETVEVYQNLSLVAPINATFLNNEDMFSCATENLARWWLANDTSDGNLDGSLPSLESLRTTQRYVLSLLYLSTDGRRWLNQDQWLTLEHECDWFGVQCDSSQSTVIRLELGGSNLNGTIPRELGLLSSLTVLDLNENLISGTLPQQLLMQLELLQRLDVSRNSIEGPVPDVVDLAELVEAGLDFLAMNPNATITDILDNPALIGFERTLFSLDFSGNSFNGTFPSGLQLLTTLREFRADNNRLEGAILTLNLALPPGILLPAFPIPEDIFFREMEHFSMRNNLITGTLPDFLGFFTDLETWDLSNNLAVGKIPTTIGELEELVLLNISYNAYTGMVPTEILRLAQLQTLDLRGNNFSGTLPDGLCDTLVFLDTPLVDCDGDLAKNCSCCECGIGR